MHKFASKIFSKILRHEIPICMMLWQVLDKIEIFKEMEINFPHKYLITGATN